MYDEGYNDQYFRGEIANISVWSDVRTAEQIQADVQALQADAAAVSAEGETLLASWQFDGEQDLYEDRSDRDNDVAAFVDWIDPSFAQGDYSMVALPDTQFLSEKYPDIYKKLTQWIVDHEQTYNIQAVMHMGTWLTAAIPPSGATVPMPCTSWTRAIVLTGCPCGAITMTPTGLTRRSPMRNLPAEIALAVRMSTRFWGRISWTAITGRSPWETGRT